MKGEFVGTFTGKHGQNADYDNPQPALWTLGPIHAQRGKQKFPIIYKGSKTMTLNARHVNKGAQIIINGKRADGELKFSSGEKIVVTLNDIPSPGMHFLQVQNLGGLFSNDFIFHVASSKENVKEIRNSNDPNRLTRELHQSIISGNINRIKNLLEEGADPNKRNDDGGRPISTAGFHGELEIAKLLIEKGAKLSNTNTDGNTPLHVAAFLCRSDVVKLYLEKGASVSTKNRRGETPIDVVSGDWSEGLNRFYQSISNGSGLGLNIEEIRLARPKILKLLRDHLKRLNLQAKTIKSQ